MAKQPQFVEHVLEQMRNLGAVRARPFFGGWGIYWNDLIIALIADDVLYFKADDGNRSDFEALNLEAFAYEAKGKRNTMSYFRAPDEVFDDDEAMTQWAQSARAASERSAGKKVKTQNKIRVLDDGELR